jgi:hypothetical protein
MEIVKKRRRLLLGALAVGLLPTVSRGASKAMRDVRKLGGIGGAVVPANIVRLADYGGVPDASPSILKNAFSQAFAALTESGGGTLLIAPGLYDFGSYATSTYIISGNGLSNIAISAYGATFKATTTANVMPNMFYFFNFKNITIAGASFTDPGFNPSVNWKGMYCAGIQASEASSGFRMVDCFADSVIGLFASNNNATTRHYLADIDINGEVRNSYYGVGASFIKEQVNVNLICHNVRRAFIANALKNADITVTASSAPDCLGSNGLVALICEGAGKGEVENVRVRVDASGAGIYSGYVHFYHQGPEVDGAMRNIDATVNVRDVKSTSNLFVFDHEANGVQRTTSRVWDQISLHGSVTGSFGGKIISNPSISKSPGTVYVDDNLAGSAKMSALPAYFRIKSRRLKDKS